MTRELNRIVGDASTSARWRPANSARPMLAQLRLFVLTTATMIAFAANSLLARAALRNGALDATSYTVIRLASGALVLAAVVLARRDSEPVGRGSPGAAGSAERNGSWRSAWVLAAYAITFSYAYTLLSAGTGALLMFGSAQFTMITGALLRGERPTPRQWLGFVVAAAGMVVINLPSLDAPSPLGATLMIVSGVGWGMYSLSGRGAARPIVVNAGNFVRSVPLAAILAIIAALTTAHITGHGVLLAIISGGLTSGLGYCVWYRVLPTLGAARAAIVQLSVPAIAALSAVVLLDEPLRRHIVIGGAIILGGLALALWPRTVA